MGIGVAGLVFYELFEETTRPPYLAHQQTRAGHARARPGQRLSLQHPLVDLGRPLALLDLEPQLAGHLGGVGGIAAAFVSHSLAEDGGLDHVTFLQGAVGRVEHALAMPSLGQPVRQGGGGVGFEQVAVHRRFGGVHYLRVGGLGRDEDEDGPVRQQMLLP